MTSVQDTIRQLEAILNSGTTKGSVDGQAVEFQTPDEIRARIRELQRQDCKTRARRPVASTIKLGGW